MGQLSRHVQFLTVLPALGRDGEGLSRRANAPSDVDIKANKGEAGKPAGGQATPGDGRPLSEFNTP